MVWAAVDRERRGESIRGVVHDEKPPLRGFAWQSGGMSWIELLLAAAVLAAVAALTGIKPRGTRHVARTSLMKAARIVLLLIAVGLVILAIAAGG